VGSRQVLPPRGVCLQL